MLLDDSKVHLLFFFLRFPLRVITSTQCDADVRWLHKS